jgi:hypothetical protein
MQSNQSGHLIDADDDGFGSFSVAPASTPDYDSLSNLADNSKNGHLGSQYDQHPSGPSQRRSPIHPDLVDFDPLSRDVSVLISEPSTSMAHNAGAHSQPIRIRLPPPPSEMSADYEPPPMRSPRRMSQLASLAGPSSPPRLSEVGSDITFHPTFTTDQDRLAKDLKRAHISNERKRSERHQSAADGPLSSSPIQSKLLNTLATTTSLASRWKSAIHHTDSIPGSKQNPLDDSELEFSFSLGSAKEVSHVTPFATSEQLAGSYVPPTGAPSFMPTDHVKSHPHPTSPEEWSGTSLNGRRSGTTRVLEPSIADKV